VSLYDGAAPVFVKVHWFIEGENLFIRLHFQAARKTKLLQRQKKIYFLNASANFGESDFSGNYW
jgi:hypothetical protein